MVEKRDTLGTTDTYTKKHPSERTAFSNAVQVLAKYLTQSESVMDFARERL